MRGSPEGRLGNELQLLGFTQVFEPFWTRMSRPWFTWPAELPVETRTQFHGCVDESLQSGALKAGQLWPVFLTY